VLGLGELGLGELGSVSAAAGLATGESVTVARSRLERSRRDLAQAMETMRADRYCVRCREGSRCPIR
jgi:hypothetical protein